MHFSTGVFTYTSPQAGVGRIQSHRAVFPCACVCIMCACGKVDNHSFSVLSFVGNPLSDRTAATTFVCACVGMCLCISRCLSDQ